MNEASTVVRLRQPEEIDDPLTAVLRAGARRLLAQAHRPGPDPLPVIVKRSVATPGTRAAVG